MWQRMRAQAELLTTLFVMTLLLTFALTGSRALLSSATETALKETIAGAPADDRVVVAQTRFAAPEQADTGGAVIVDALPGASVRASLRTPPLPMLEYDRERLTLTDDAGIRDAAELTSGAWPTGAGQAAVQEEAADLLELTPGDQITITAEGSRTPLVITGTWAPRDPEASIWGEDATSKTGIDASAAFAVGPALVAQETILALDTDPFLRWQVLPEGISSTAVPAWQRALPGLADRLGAEGVSHRGVTVAGGLAGTLGQAQDSLSAIRAVTPIPYSLLSVVGGIALWQVFTLLKLHRGPETTILRARGASSATFVAWSGTEGALIAVPAAALGAAGSLLLGSGHSPWYLAAGIASIVVVMAILTGSPRWRLPGNRADIAAGGMLALLLGAAAFTLWRLLRSGAAVLPGSARVDALAASAPAVTLLAVAAVTVAILGPLLAGVSRLVARGTGLSPTFETRLAARRGVGAGVVVLLVVLAATAGLAVTYWGTWQNLRDTSEQVSAGADLVVLDRMTARGLEELRETDGVDAAAGVFTATYAAGEGGGELTGLTRAGYEAGSAPESILPPSLPETLAAAELRGPVIEGLEISAAVSVAAEPEVVIESIWKPRDFAFHVHVWNGEILERVEMGRLQASTAGRSATLTATLPGPGPWQVIAVDTLLDVRGNPTDFSVEIDIAGADFDGFTPSIIAPPTGEYTATGPLAFTATLMKEDSNHEMPGVPTLQRFMPADAPGPIPLAVTPGWTGPESTTAIRISGLEIMAEPVAELPVIPGNASQAGVLTDTGAVAEALLRAGVTSVNIDQAWVATGEPRALARTLGQDRVQIPSSAWASLSVLVPRLFLVMAALAVVLAIPAIGAAVMGELRGRRGEVVVMRAIGAEPRAQARYRRREFTLVFALATAIGALAGGVLAWVVSAPLIRSTTPQVSAAVPIALGVDRFFLAVFLGTLICAGAAAMWWYGRRVARQARDPLWREEA